jgi:hypothetical protein
MLVSSLLSLLIFTMFSTPKVEASENGDDYDTIVKDLSNSNRAPLPISPRSDVLNSTVIHSGLAYASSYSAVRTAGGQRLHAHLQGVQASLGIDLFSRTWMAEGSARSFSDYSSPEGQMSLKEFDIKLVNKGLIAPQLGYRLGAGLAARYMTVNETVSVPVDSKTPGATTATDLSTDYVTPASVIMAGLDLFLSDSISVGSEFSYRSALISQTIDHVAYDFVVKLDAHF